MNATEAALAVFLASAVLVAGIVAAPILFLVRRLAQPEAAAARDGR